MKNLFLLFLIISSISFGQDATKTITGIVSDGKNPLDNVKISVLESKNTVFTDVSGKYAIKARIGDILTYNYQGMKTIKIKVEDITRTLNPVMIPDITELDEVIVEASERRSQKDLELDYSINNNIIKTAYGFIDLERSPGRTRILTSEEINPVSICVLDLLRNRFAGLTIIGDCFEGGEVFSQRGLRSGPLIWDIDGVILGNQGPFTPSAPIWLDVNNIKRLAVFTSLSNVVQYGNIGASGVIVVNTISGNTVKEQIIDRARLNNNFVLGKKLTRQQIAANAPEYLKELNATTTLLKAKEIFDSNETKYQSSPYFYLDGYTFFSEKYEDKDYADSILEKGFNLFDDNPVLLKALAYIYESQGRYDKAHNLTKEVFIQRPNYAQSYLDLANSYRNIGSKKLAAGIYNRYDYLLGEGFMQKDTAGFYRILQREYNNLLALHKNEIVDSKKAKDVYVADESFDGTRLVFEWNDSEAEFDLQFVNPENQYYTWKHSLAANAETIYSEKDYGYNTTEYLLDYSLPGTWTVNVSYSGNKSLTPTYLKATIYYNYGTNAQSKEVKVFKLSLKNVNQELFKIQSIARIASN